MEFNIIIKKENNLFIYECIEESNIGTKLPYSIVYKHSLKDECTEDMKKVLSKIYNVERKEIKFRYDISNLPKDESINDILSKQEFEELKKFMDDKNGQ